MERKTYELTASDLKKIDQAAKNGDLVAAVDAERPTDAKSKLYRKWSLKKRDAALRMMRNTPAYRRGKGQGALDLACDLGYAEKTNCRAYNCGYHEGYTHPANLRDLIEHNSNFAFLKG